MKLTEDDITEIIGSVCFLLMLAGTVLLILAL